MVVMTCGNSPRTGNLHALFDYFRYYQVIPSDHWPFTGTAAVCLQLTGLSSKMK